MSESVAELAKFIANATIGKSTTNNQGQSQQTIDDFVTYNPNVLIDANTSIYSAAKTMLHQGVTGVPVTDSSQNLIGFLSEKDCLKHAYEDEYHNTPQGGLVTDYMTKQVVALKLGSPLFESIDLFLKFPFHVYPVLGNENKVVGILERTKILSAVCDLKAH